jgi:hypothetical protein
MACCACALFVTGTAPAHGQERNSGAQAGGGANGGHAAAGANGAQAGGSADTRADTLFKAAKQLKDAGQVADACPMFAESKRIAPGVGVTLHLADCYEKMGRTASAWDQFREAESMARARGDDKRADLAHTRAVALEGKLDRLTVASSAQHAGWQVLLDGVALPADHLNAAMAVDPGDHAVVVQAPGQAPRTLHARLGAGGDAATLRLDSPPAAGAVGAGGGAGGGGAGGNGAGGGGSVVAQASAAPSGEAPHAEPSEPVASGEHKGGGGLGVRTWIEIGLFGLAAVGAGMGTWFWVRHDQLMSRGDPCDPPLENDAAIGEAISYGVGGAALGTALILQLTRPTPKVETGRAMVAPSLLPGGGGAVFRATF